jgi:hypothetical protein
MDKASERLFALKPVTFRAKGSMDPAHVKHYGLIAEDVAAVDSDLVVYNPEGKPESLRFDSINAMLLNEFLKEHQAFLAEQRKVTEHEATINDVKSTLKKEQATFAQQRKDFEASVAQQQKQIQALTASLKEQGAQIQKVGAALELTKPRQQTVVNNQQAMRHIQRETRKASREKNHDFVQHALQNRFLNEKAIIDQREMKHNESIN